MIIKQIMIIIKKKAIEENLIKIKNQNKTFYL